ncbi:3-isopropylmalate dehydratase [Oceanicola sp. 22II-s10i]|uniref:3-isopropylmalate dehydratase small subunit n=1 Tax=Oceanicola sp. 22II-s10i TaxID=1317116 RepID=UPI000B52750F|nr:3-isopropylmalate dehydratase small subunit [Oceanicola sp. 22II-s10i]OWU83128.1 3-isopropylmalate dehydratase [Oceanicola sp. 22II-s10i]
MDKFTKLTAPALPVDQPNVDTDQLAPARFLRRPRGDGYADVLFHDLRKAEGGHIVDDPRFAGAGIVVADRNFGGGSSREQAVWSLVDAGFRCVIASSFGDIFYANSAKHGLLTIRLDNAVCKALRDALHATPGAEMTVDLDAQTIVAPDGEVISFEIEPSRRKRLLQGLDDIDLTLTHDAAIGAFEAEYSRRKPWLELN